MELEDLANYNYYELAKNIVRYQKFKPSVALSKFPQNVLNNFSKSTLGVYINLGVKYLTDGTVKNGFCSMLYKSLDKCKEEHVQPLIPSFEDERKPYKYVKKYQKKEAIVPAQIAVHNITKGKSLTSKFDYGVKIHTKDYPYVVIFKSEEEAKSFMFALNMTNNDDNIEMVSVELGKV